MRPVLKYPGSKWHMAKRLVDLIPEHHSYLEPYFGSGAVLFNKPRSDIETINDLDSDVVNLFRCIQRDSARLSRLVMTTPFAREEYDRQFAGDPCQRYASDFQRAAGFLVRCWQGHGCETTGYKAGWKRDVQGRERAYALRDWYQLPEWIIEITDRLRMVQIENQPAVGLIKQFDYSSVFMYIDPPYLLGTKNRRMYRKEMTDGDHEELLRTVLGTRAMVMISGYESEMYNDYLAGWRKVSFPSRTQTGQSKEEVVWMNYSMGKQMSIFDMPEVMG